MDKPWQEIIPPSALGDYAEKVESEVGSHVRTRPGEGYTPPGGGRPTGPVHDDSPMPYHQGRHDTTYGIPDTEELAAPPQAERAPDGKAPMQPQEFEAAWIDRFRERTQKALAARPAGSALILPADYEPAPVAELDDEVVTLQRKLRAAEQRADQRKRDAEWGASHSVLVLHVDLTTGGAKATLTSASTEQEIDPKVGLALIHGLLK
jgi:hypothetical protein